MESSVERAVSSSFWAVSARLFASSWMRPLAPRCDQAMTSTVMNTATSTHDAAHARTHLSVPLFSGASASSLSFSSTGEPGIGIGATGASATDEAGVTSCGREASGMGIGVPAEVAAHSSVDEAGKASSTAGTATSTS